MGTDQDVRLWVGTSGWQYDHWRGRVYPQDLPKSRWMAHYATHFDCGEGNGTFYNLPTAQTVDDWREQAAPGFRFACKYSRFGTHNKKLKDPTDHLALFLDPVEHLKSHLGPILVQLPPQWKPNLERLDEFLQAAPKRHRWAVEIRQRDWLGPELEACLERHRAALAVHDMIEDHPRTATADWTYCRFHGDRYRGRYGRERLQPWADWMRSELDAGRPVWAFFNNDDSAYAVEDALLLRDLVQDGR
jgi:uncharacterized protein YecE (DUF72 family)